MRRLAFALTLAFGFSALAVDSETWRDAKLSYRQKFAFTAAASTCPQFPLAIVGNATYFKIAKGRMKTGCWGVWDQDGNQWNGEEVSLSDDGTYQTFEFHASLSTFDLYTAKTALWLYYDPTNAPTTSKVGTTGSANGKAVWDGNFVGVWHMQEAKTPCLDSTAKGLSLDGGGDVSFGAAGIIGLATKYAATDSWLSSASDSLILEADISITTWVNLSAYDNAAGLVNRGGGSPYAGYYLRVVSGNAEWFLYSDGTNKATVAFTKDTIQYVAATYTDSTEKTTLSINAGTPATATISPGKRSQAATFVVGALSYATSLAVTGIMDETRLSQTPRSAAWIASEYANGLAGNGLTLDGSEQTQPAGGVPKQFMHLERMRRP